MPERAAIHQRAAFLGLTEKMKDINHKKKKKGGPVHESKRRTLRRNKTIIGYRAYTRQRKSVLILLK